MGQLLREKWAWRNALAVSNHSFFLRLEDEDIARDIENV
jgi:hypothetical protein